MQIHREQTFQLLNGVLSLQEQINFTSVSLQKKLFDIPVEILLINKAGLEIYWDFHIQKLKCWQSKTGFIGKETRGTLRGAWCPTRCSRSCHWHRYHLLLWAWCALPSSLRWNTRRCLSHPHSFNALWLRDPHWSQQLLEGNCLFRYSFQVSRWTHILALSFIFPLSLS